MHIYYTYEATEAADGHPQLQKSSYVPVVSVCQIDVWDGVQKFGDDPLASAGNITGKREVGAKTARLRLSRGLTNK